MNNAETISALDTLFASDRDGFLRALRSLEGGALDEKAVAHLDRFRGFFTDGKRMVATTDPDRTASPGEYVVCFGNYPPGYHALPINNPARRNILDFFSWDGAFDAVEGHPCWQAVDRCFVISLDSRPDRFYSALRELARVGFPLDRVVRHPGHVPAPTGDRQVDGQVGSLTSHLQVVRRARAEDHRHVLVLEDDFGFLDDIGRVQDDVAQFFARDYAYDVCLLATSKHGRIDPMDDLVSITRQPCTNAAGHFVSREGLGRLEACFGQSLERLHATGDTIKYAVDRCWQSLQGERFLVFKRRLGFQLPSFSDIEGEIVGYFD